MSVPTLKEGKAVRATNKQQSICPCGYPVLETPLGQEYIVYLWSISMARFKCGSCELSQDVHVLLAEREGVPPAYLPLACFFEEVK